MNTYPYFFTKIIILFICLVVMSVSTFMNDLIEIKIDLSNNKKLRKIINGTVENIKSLINKELGPQISQQDLECINNKLENFLVWI